MRPMKFVKFLDRYLERQVLHFTAICVICIVLIALTYMCLTPASRQIYTGTCPANDYDSFYVAGTILNEHGPQRLYDVDLQNKIKHELKPYLASEARSPYVYAPFFALPFWLIAPLGYTSSYLAWLLILTCLYGAGLILIFETTKAIPKRDIFTCALLAFSFGPFTFNCFLWGQTSPFGFFAIALAFYLFQRDRRFWSGLPLGLCFYKPPLLILIGPLLLVCRQWKVLLGLSVSALALTLISVGVFGYDTCADWAGLVLDRAKRATPKEAFETFYNADVIASLRFLLRFGIPDHVIRIIGLVMSGLSLVSVALVVKQAGTFDRYRRGMVVATILSWTAVFNIYFPIHDSIIIVIGLLLTIDARWACYGEPTKVFDPKFKVLLVLVYLSLVPSQVLAKYIGFQFYTIILVLLGVYQLAMLRKLVTPVSSPPSSAPERPHPNKGEMGIISPAGNGSRLSTTWVRRSWSIIGGRIPEVVHPEFWGVNSGRLLMQSGKKWFFSH